MKKLILFIAAFIATFTVFGQYFEGKIVYKNSYISKNPKVKDDQWISMMGSNQEFFIKSDNYKSISNGTLIQWQLYISKENKIYNKLSNSLDVTWIDASVQGDEILNIEVNKDVIEILGYKCNEVILTCKSGVQKHYYNAKLVVDYKLFANHKFGNWYDFLLKSKSLPLKSIIETAQFTMISIATEVKPMVLDNTIFNLPAGIKTSKSTY